jgi:hypothetical protein
MPLEPSGCVCILNCCILIVFLTEYLRCASISAQIYQEHNDSQQLICSIEIKIIETFQVG